MGTKAKVSSHLIRLEPDVTLGKKSLGTVGPKLHLLVRLAHFLDLLAVHTAATGGCAAFAYSSARIHFCLRLFGVGY